MLPSFTSVCCKRVCARFTTPPFTAGHRSRWSGSRSTSSPGSSVVALQQKRLAWAALWSYDLAALGSITLDLGISNGIQEYRESDREIYIPNWYTIGGFIFTTILGVTAALTVNPNLRPV